MTRADFYLFANDWALMKAKGVNPPGKTSHDESYIFRIFRDINAPTEWTARIAIASTYSRLEYFKSRSKSGLKYNHDVDWNEKYNLEQSLSYLSSVAMADSVDYMLSVCKEMVDLELYRWGYSGEFTYHSFDGLARMAREVSEDKSDNGNELRAIFARNKAEIRSLYDSLRTIRRSGPRGDVIIVGMPQPPRLRESYDKLRFPMQVDSLEKVLEIIKDW